MVPRSLSGGSTSPERGMPSPTTPCARRLAAREYAKGYEAHHSRLLWARPGCGDRRMRRAFPPPGGGGRRRRERDEHVLGAGGAELGDHRGAAFVDVVDHRGTVDLVVDLDVDRPVDDSGRWQRWQRRWRWRGELGRGGRCRSRGGRHGGGHVGRAAGDHGRLRGRRVRQAGRRLRQRAPIDGFVPGRDPRGHRRRLCNLRPASRSNRDTSPRISQSVGLSQSEGRSREPAHTRRQIALCIRSLHLRQGDRGLLRGGRPRSPAAIRPIRGADKS